MATSFLANLFEQQNVEEWDKQYEWIHMVIEMLAESDSERARRVSWKALDSSHSYILGAAFKALGEVGTMEDAVSLKEWILQEKGKGKLSDIDGFAEESSTVAKKAIENIKMRMAKPQDFKEIKAMLDAYGLSINMMTQELLNARESFRAKSDLPIHALLFLYEQNAIRWHRDAIILAFMSKGFVNPAERKIAADFFAKKLLESDVEQWDKEKWRVSDVMFFVGSDTEQGRRVARKALNSSERWTRNSAIRSLESIGTMEDVERLNALISRREEEGKNSSHDEPSLAAKKAIRQITLRTSNPQDYRDIRVMLGTFGLGYEVDKELLDVRESFRAKGDDPVQVLLFLFEKNARVYIRDEIIEAIQKRGPEKSKKIAADFLAKKFLESEMSEINRGTDGKWIYAGREILVEANPEQARKVARQMLNSQEKLFEWLAVLTLAEVGTEEDVAGLDALARREKSKPDNESTTSRIEKTIEQIKERTKGKKGKPDEEK